MDKKFIFAAIIIIILAIIGCFMVFNNFGNGHIEVKGTQFALPDGFTESTVLKDGNANITNGNTSLIFVKYGGSNIQQYIDKYVDYNKERNYTTKLSNFTAGGVEVYKAAITENKNVFHYWFVKDDNVFEVFTRDGNDQTDKIVLELVKN